MSGAFNSIHDEGAAPSRLRPAAGAGEPSRQAAGPFDIAAAEERDASFGGVLMTGLLVIYPAFATVAAIVAGLSLSGGGA